MYSIVWLLVFKCWWRLKYKVCSQIIWFNQKNTFVKILGLLLTRSPIFQPCMILFLFWLVLQITECIHSTVSSKWYCLCLHKRPCWIWFFSMPHNNKSLSPWYPWGYLYFNSVCVYRYTFGYILFLVFETLNNSVLMSCFILHDIIIKYYCSPFNRAEFNISYLICTVIRINENMVFVSSKFCLCCFGI